MMRNQFILFDYADIEKIEYSKSFSKWIPQLVDANKEDIPYGLPSLPFEGDKTKPKIPRPYLLQEELDEYIRKKEMRQNRGKKISFLPSHTLLQMAKYHSIQIL